jgi:hypothetical protein
MIKTKLWLAALSAVLALPATGVQAEDVPPPPRTVPDKLLAVCADEMGALHFCNILSSRYPVVAPDDEKEKYLCARPCQIPRGYTGPVPPQSAPKPR